jgi:tripartite-type tricarboxylate transporter receptor subunit TctC
LGIGEGDKYLAKPVSIIIHSKPGSAIDYMARKVAEIARKHSHVAFVVDNRPGTQGLVAMQHVLDAKVDGYTLLGVTKSFLSTLMVNKSKVSLGDFQFIANMVSDPEALISNEERGFSSLSDIISDSKSGEQQVWIGPGNSSRDHLMALKSWETLGVDVKWIDYKSGPQSILAMLRNESAVYVGNPADTKGKSNLTIVSIASEKRLASLPDVPTFKEQGYDLSESMWRGFAFKKGVPGEAVGYVTDVLQNVVNDPEWESYCDETYVFSSFENQNEFTQRINREVAETNHYLNKAGLLVEYKKESPLNMFLVFILIAGFVFLLLTGLNKFKIYGISYDQIVAGGIMSFALFFLYQTLLFQILAAVNITSRALIPRIWIVVLVLTTLWLIVRPKQDSIPVNVKSSKIVLIIIGFLLIYLFAMQWLGYVLVTSVFILATMYLLKYRKPAFMMINGFGFVVFSYLIFNKLLNIDLPMGWLFV